MFIPPQGFRHATALLLTQACRAIPPGASPDAVSSALAALAHDLVALADDMRAAPESAEWLLVEYARIVEQLPHTFDRGAAQASASAILAHVARRHPVVESRDLFLVYVPEDRLPVAAPLGVELIKRRVSVALDYEVATGPQLSAALEHGLEHAGGVVAHVVAGDVALVLQEDAQALLQLRGRREHLRLARQDGVANASEKIRDWVSH